jgi:hypothetical protein
MMDRIVPVRCEVCGQGGAGVHGWMKVCENCKRFICYECWNRGKDQNPEYPNCEHRTITPKRRSDLLHRTKPRNILIAVSLFLIFLLVCFLFRVLSK